MVARVRYDDPVANVMMSETATSFMVRAEIPRDAIGRHLEVLTAMYRGLEALLAAYNEPLGPEEV